jgi:fatty acid desaturase
VTRYASQVGNNDSVRARIDQRSDVRGLAHLIGHLVTLCLTGVFVVRSWGTWFTGPAVVMHAYVLIFLFSAAHESVHRTAFRTRRLNDFVSWAAGVLLLLPSRWFRLFHAAHHRYTQQVGLDPELDGWKPPTRVGIVLHQSGLLYWKALAIVVANLVRGRADATWLPKGHRIGVIREARFNAVLYVGAIAVSVATRSWLLVQLWVIPALVGQPFLRWFLLAEHTGCQTDAGVILGTRTTLTNPIVRFFAWNMPFHAEHHAHPQIPFHRLAEEHRKWTLDPTLPRWGSLDTGYVRTIARMQKQRWHDAPKP